MSFNIRYGTASDGKRSWVHRRNAVLKMLSDQDFDIIGLQEALRFQLDEIRSDLSWFHEIGSARDDGKHSGEYAAILYRSERFKLDSSDTFWFSNTPHIPGSLDWGSRHPRICTWARLIEKRTGRGVYIYNVHLDHRSNKARRNSVKLLAQKISLRQYEDPVIITGDFNCHESSRIIRYLKGVSVVDKIENKVAVPAFVDSFRVLHPNAPGCTMNIFFGYPIGPKIDFIFVEPGTEVLESQILREPVNGKYPSDHFPIVARVRLPQGGRAANAVGQPRSRNVYSEPVSP